MEGSSVMFHVIHTEKLSLSSIKTFRWSQRLNQGPPAVDQLTRSLFRDGV